MSVIDLEQRQVARLAGDLVDELHSRGVVVANLDEIDDVARWRKAARVAARMLELHVRTGVSKGVVWAASDDWLPAADADRHAAQLVAAIIHTAPQRD